jgi:3',5'-cyclic AMP phosphodiesterase CpdA
VSNREIAFKIAHLSDLHLGPLPRVRLLELMSKRMLGYVSWIRRRRRHHRSEALEAIVEDIGASHIDHTVITGDLVNIALPEEFTAAARWLRAFGPPARVTLVPGNHDAYVASGAGRWSAWAPYMSADHDAAEIIELPFVKQAGPITLIGLSTAIATPAGFASGVLGTRQLTALDRILRELREQAAVRVVLLHHPPVEGWSKRRKALDDAARFRDIIGRHGAELVLCGHEHRLMIGGIAGPEGEIPVFCAPSASLAQQHGRRAGGYIVYSFELGEGACRIIAEHRALDVASGLVETRFEARFERALERGRRSASPGTASPVMALPEATGR